MKTGIHSTPAPKISGEVRTGEWLTVDPGTWGPDGVELSYQWFRGDHAVSSGTTTRYKVSTADLGKKLSVTVTGRKKSLTTVSKTSEPTAAAKATPVLDASAAGDKGKAVVTLIVTAPTVPMPTGFGTVSEGSKTLKTLDLAIGRPGRATLRVTLSKGTHTLTVSYSGSETVAPGVDHRQGEGQLVGSSDACRRASSRSAADGVSSSSPEASSSMLRVADWSGNAGAGVSNPMLRHGTARVGPKGCGSGGASGTESCDSRCTETGAMTSAFGPGHAAMGLRAGAVPDR